MKTSLNKKIQLLLLLFTGSLISMNAQVIVSDPAFPAKSDAIDITFNVDECDCNLEGYTGDIYAHTGLITTESTGNSDWKHVIAGWTENLEKAKLEKTGASTYVLHITPSLVEYYGIPAELTVEKIAFVFRSADGSLQTADLFQDIYDSGLSLSWVEPKGDVVVTSGEQITVSAASVEQNTTEVDSMMLYLDDVLTYTSFADTLYYQFNATGSDKHWMKVVTVNSEFTVADSQFYYVREEVPVADFPDEARIGVTPIGEDSAVFALYAPYKDNVFLLGDFNNWELNNEYLMNQTVSGDTFWIGVGGLSPEMEYAYQYLIDGSIRIADPYTKKVLDPANDPFIPASTYPDLKPYPEGKTTGIISVMQTVDSEYTWTTTDFTPANKTDLVIYELHVQNFTEAGTFSALLDTLDYLERLGVNAIELMPVNEFEGNQSWGYNPSFYFALDKIYGTPNDFKALVDAAHERGIAVLIDMVYNHTYGQSPLLHMYWNETAGKPSTNNPWYNENHNFVDNTSAQWGYDIDHESAATQALIDSVNRFWMTEYRVDGFRFDFTKGMSNTPWSGSDNWASAYDEDRIAILKRMTNEIWARNENAIVIFEHLADNSEEKELADHGIMLWGNMNHNYNEATMGYNESNKSDLSWGVYSTRGWDNPHLVTYMESHDEERLMYKNQRWGNEVAGYSTQELRVALQRAEAAAAFFFTLPGPKMIWEWGELGYDYSINRCPDGTVDDDGGCRLALKPLGWDFYDEPMRYRLFKAYQALIDFKMLGIMETEDFNISVTGAMKKIHLNSADTNVTIIGNFGMSAATIDSAFQHTGTWFSYMTGESIEVSDVSAPIELQPGEYYIYTDVALESPDLPAGIATLAPQQEALQLYPNPASDQISFISPHTGKGSLKIYGINGQILQQEELNLQTGQPVTILLTNIPQGVYLYQLITSHNTRQGKFVAE